MPKYRGAKITSPAQANVIDLEFNDDPTFDRRAADDSMIGDPVKTKIAGSGSFSIVSGALPTLYNHTLIVQVKDVSVANAVETITTRTHTFTKVTGKPGYSGNNDGGESTGKVAFEYGNRTES